LISALTIICETIRNGIIPKEIVLDKTMKKGKVSVLLISDETVKIFVRQITAQYYQS